MNTVKNTANTPSVENENIETSNNLNNTPTNISPPPKNTWQALLKPVAVLVIICFISGVVLTLTNAITQPIIAENSASEEDRLRKELLPEATSFEDITPSPLPESISSVYKADGDKGYVISSYAQGYGGKVPALVGIDSTGTVTGVKFLENDETPGLGQKVVTDSSFATQFIGRKADVQVQDTATATTETDATATATAETGAETDATATATAETDAETDATATAAAETGAETDATATATAETGAETDATATATTENTEDDFTVQAIAAATISSDAAANAVEYALEYYAISIMGSTISYSISDDVLKELMPNASSWHELSLTATDVASAYAGDDGTYVIVAQGKSQNTIYAAVALNQDGTITGLWLDTSKESPNYGLEIAENQDYIAQYIGQSNTDSVQGVAGVTNTSKGIKAAVDAALNAFPLAKEAT